MQLKLYFDVTLYAEAQQFDNFFAVRRCLKNKFLLWVKQVLIAFFVISDCEVTSCLSYVLYRNNTFCPCMRPGPFITLKRGSLDSIKQRWDNSTKIIQIINSSTYFIMLALVSKSPLYLCVRLLTNFIVSKWATKLVSSGRSAYYIFTHF